MPKRAHWIGLGHLPPPQGPQEQFPALPPALLVHSFSLARALSLYGGVAPGQVSRATARAYEAIFSRLVLSDPAAVAVAAVPLVPPPLPAAAANRTAGLLRGGLGGAAAAAAAAVSGSASDGGGDDGPSQGWGGFSVYEDALKKPGLIATAPGSSVVLHLSGPNPPTQAAVNSPGTSGGLACRAARTSKAPSGSRSLRVYGCLA